MDASAVRDAAADLPRDPGVYQFERADGTVLYLGKAVDLRSRVRSYADPRSNRIRRMVGRADRLDFAVTDTETQALLLEANLVKRHQPRYNVRLKDDKSYPLVQLTDHEFPRIEVTRDPNEGSEARSVVRESKALSSSRETPSVSRATSETASGGTASQAVVYGPFTDKGRVETVVKALRETYGVRGCSDHKYANRDRPCLDYDLGLCTAPCTDEIDRESYVADVESVKRFFEGETGVLADPLRRAMDDASQAENFERAANLRDRLRAVEAFHGGGGEAVAAESGERAVDVLGVAVEGDRATVARLHAEGGQLVERDRHVVSAPETDEEDGADEDADSTVPAILAAFIPQYYAERELPDALLLPERHGDPEVAAWLDAEGVAVRVPGAGREAKLVDLALRNAHRHAGQGDDIGDLAERLGIARPSRIEGFDVSHAQGKAAVGSNVAFEDGSADKSGYRRKKLDDENDDYANMRALVAWRASRAVEGRDDRPDPDLLLIDGGKGQLQAARDALDDAGWDVPVVALAKREETVVTEDGERRWPDDSSALHVLQRVRDEAHRFAVQYHQTVRDTVETVLDDVDGVGPELRKRLLRRFGSVEGVREASVEELRGVEGVGEATAETISRRL